MSKDTDVLDRRESTYSILLKHQSYIEIIARPGCEMEKKYIEEDMALIDEMAPEYPCPFLIVMGEMKGINREARTYTTEDAFCRRIEKLALLTGNMITRVIGNFYVNIHKPCFPTRLFTSRDSALAWLGEKDVR